MWAIVCSAVVMLLILPLLWRWNKNKRKWYLMSKIPGARGWPILGSVNELCLFNTSYKNFNPLAIFLQSLDGLSVLYRKEKLYKLYLGPDPIVVLFAPEILEPIFKSNSLIDKGAAYDLFREWLGEGLLTSSGKKWHQHRKLLTPTFHFRILDDFVSVMNEQSRIFVNKINKNAQTQEWFDAHHDCSMFTFDVICETAMGVSIGAQNNADSPYVKALHEFTEIATTRLASPALLFNNIFYFSKYYKNYRKTLDIMIDFTTSVVKDKILKQQHKVDDFQAEEGKKRLAFLDLLLEQSENMFDAKTLREQVDSFMFAGHDTTGSGLAWLLYLLGIYQDVQSRVLDELDEIFGGDKDRDVTQEDLKHLKYLDCVIKESQRLYSPVPFISRTTCEEFNVGGYVIPKDTEVFIAIYLLHRNPDVFPDPGRFDPDRFLPENSVGRHPFAFTPFSAGPRNCIGQRFALMEEKVFVCQVLRHFRVSSLDQRDKLHVIPAAVLRNVGPLRIQFHKRQ